MAELIETNLNAPEVQALDAAPDRIDWIDLSPEDKQKLLQRTSLIYGAYADGSMSALPVLDVEIAERSFNGRDLHNGESKAETVHTEREFSLVQKGWTEASAEVSSPWISASVKYREEEERGRTTRGEYIYTTATYRIPTYQAQITKEDAAKALSSKFLEAVKKAVEGRNPLQALQSVFEDYGYILQLKVELGASITMSATQEIKEETNELTTKKTLEAEVSGKYGDFAGGASFGKGDETQSKSMVKNQVGSVKVNVNGGDKKLLTDTKKWLETTEDIKRLTIIGTYSVVTITDLIELRDKDLFEKVQKVFGQPLIGKWVVATSQGSSGEYNLRVGFPEGDWAKEGWCCIGDSLESIVVLLVKEAPGHSGALGTCTFDPEGDLQIRYSSDDVVEYELVIRRADPDSDAYASIGAVVRRPRDWDHPFDMGNPDNFRAIRKDLLAPATIAFEPTEILTRDRYLVGGPPLGWKIVPQDPNVGIETEFFWAATSDGQRDTMLKQDLPLYVLKKSAVQMINTPEDVLNQKADEWINSVRSDV